MGSCEYFIQYARKCRVKYICPDLLLHYNPKKWYANYSLAFHSVLLACSVWIYFGQRTPKVPAMLEIANLIQHSQAHTEKTLGHVQAMHMSNQILWSDPGLRQVVAKWYDERKDSISTLTSDESLDQLCAAAQDIGLDSSALRQSCRTAAKEIWLSSQESGKEWEKFIAFQQANAPTASKS
jgi:hypothetical protein